ncbi:uncharacterized protein [Ptychodera flava]|uniref:uncharacterized protein n=1 Tax=Ptychodera flava TaxID=63121 RepID=UPI003969F280
MIHQAEDLSNPSNSASLINNITESIDTAYAGDIILAESLMSDIVGSDPLSSQSTDNDKTTYLQAFVDLASALLDTNNTGSWTGIHEARSPHSGAVMLFSTLETFGKTVHRYIHRVNTDVRLHSKNIDFEARRIKSQADDLTFPSNNVLKIKKRSPEIVWDDLDEGGSKVIIPKENFVFQNTVFQP